ncbi:ligase-associated DNA damage response endonuclease PdeM [Pseudotabrizicola sp. L79]|uniref:ligase-associated DNA damage response endonuclease PdeM n=1 Tax=Pseudotabrizicola sp. L79 TaxID=3118402 RepID=UPI002F920C4C
MHHSLTFHTETLHCLPSGALFWPAQGLLCVSDLHLGKSERLARRGGTLLPPYETRATLSRLEADLTATDATTIICLGDSFDDSAALDGLDETDRLWLIRLIAGRNWVWVAGNHDAGPLNIAGTHLAQVKRPPLTFRHIAEPNEMAEISGHYHPKLRLAGQAHRCFLVDAKRMILPAYGAYTGGLWSFDPALSGLMAPDSIALACTAGRVLAVPMPRSSTKAR